MLNKGDIWVADFSMIDFRDFKLPMITIYEKPLDYPDKFVVRLWDLDRPTYCMALADTLYGARKLIPEGFIKVLREESDDPKIVETWL